jgi:antibiotic biosynthesis monooxygenase (ABM) superfamily enzyme
MAITLIVVVFVIVWPLNVFLGPVLTNWGFPLFAKIFTIAVIQVLLMTYLVMPWVTRRIRGWLFKP